MEGPGSFKQKSFSIRRHQTLVTVLILIIVAGVGYALVQAAPPADRSVQFSTFPQAFKMKKWTRTPGPTYDLTKFYLTRNLELTQTAFYRPTNTPWPTEKMIVITMVRPMQPPNNPNPPYMPPLYVPPAQPPPRVQPPINIPAPPPILRH